MYGHFVQKNPADLEIATKNKIVYNYRLTLKLVQANIKIKNFGNDSGIVSGEFFLEIRDFLEKKE
jgi:hypothetical protein